jgi:UPF0042 nucleotide-binding protein
MTGRLILVSGLSGSGKTVALHTLEDAGFFCVDNIPLPMLDALLQELEMEHHRNEGKIAISVDVRSGQQALADFPAALRRLRARSLRAEVIFLDCADETLLRRYHYTRRRHPLARKGRPLTDAIALERNWLEPVLMAADLRIDTSDLTMHELAALFRTRITAAEGERLSLLFQSFGFKYGIPSDADFVFDVRCLPNPHYEPGLATCTGHDRPVVDFLKAHADVEDMFQSIQNHLLRWIPCFARGNRSYVTVAVGCTGGRHRSVYLAERLGQAWKDLDGATISVRHRELDQTIDTKADPCQSDYS